MHALTLSQKFELSHQAFESEYPFPIPYEAIPVGSVWNLFPTQQRFGIFQSPEVLKFVVHDTQLPLQGGTQAACLKRWTCLLSALQVDDFEIATTKYVCVPNVFMSPGLHCKQILQVLMIDIDGNWILTSFQVMFLLHEENENGE